jgi:S-adenosylmethionine hydrolase
MGETGARTSMTNKNSHPPVDGPLSGIVTLLTDFGIDDPFVGMVKGVLLARFPEAKLVDLSHSVPARDVRHGAFWLARTHGWFPAGTVHLAVVEPGLRAAPRAVAARVGLHYFVGPNNGLLSTTIDQAARAGSSPIEVREIDLGRFAPGKSSPSRSHHGRDLYAPVAADLAAGRLPLSQVGELLEDVARSPIPQAHKRMKMIEGEIVFVDHFGNLVTNVDARMIEEMPNATAYVQKRAIPMADSYFDVDPGEYVALINSLGTLEIARRDSHAGSSLGVGQGATVVVG